MITRIDNDTGAIHCRCGICGAEFTYSIPAGDAFPEFHRTFAGRLACDDCQARMEREDAERRIAAKKSKLADTLDERMREAGFAPRFASMDRPYVHHAAEWLWRKRESNLLLGGPTGTGKTSGAAFIVRLMLKDAFLNVRYSTRQGLIADYVRAKTSDGDSEQAFYGRIARLDILVVDEMVGKKGSGRLTDSSQELFFSLVDGAYSGERRTRIWLLGNFYAGAVDDLFDDPAPIKRRLAEAFALGWADRDKVDNIAL
jgi:DNA replication protein DnaC